MVRGWLKLYSINFSQLTPYLGGSYGGDLLPCYSPLLMQDLGFINPDTGKHVMKFLGRAITLNHPLYEDADSYLIVPCNRCIGCRLDYARQWSNRMLLELVDNPKALFVTLTYDNDHVPTSDLGFHTVCVRDCQLFFKNLRKHFTGKRIRYFLSSEYGPKRGRPHYHCIIYGLDFTDFPDLCFLKYNKLKQPLYFSDILAKKIWKNGFCVIGSVSKQSCSYTARYMLKKYKGKDTSYYDKKHIHPEFSLSSRRPGIGLAYFDKHGISTSSVSVFDGNESVTFPIPKKLFDKLVDLDPVLYNQLKQDKKCIASSNAWLEWQKSDLEFLEYLDMKESEIYRRIKGIDSTTRLDI